MGSSKKENKILTPKGAKPKETYSHGISVPIGDKEMIFVTGQIAAKNGVAVARGDITEYEFWQIVCSALNINMSSTESLWGDAVEEVFNEKMEMFELIDELKRKGYKIGFLSNTEMPAVEYWKRNDYEKYFDASVFCNNKIN